MQVPSISSGAGPSAAALRAFSQDDTSFSLEDLWRQERNAGVRLTPTSKLVGDPVRRLRASLGMTGWRHVGMTGGKRWDRAARVEESVEGLVAVPVAPSGHFFFPPTQRIHFIGIGGIGMSGIAEILLTMGYP